jgi:SAM-dependent methyltransferase
MWSFGDYEHVARLLHGGAMALMQQLDVTPGMAFLDVATGNGNVALLAAEAGAEVTGLDLTSQYFGDARRRAREAGVAISLIEGDAEALPFPSASFDRVTSTFGVQFAPRHEQAAAELARVCRPGGVIGLCNWTAAGWTGRFQEILASYFPPPPEFARPPMLWGDEDYLRELFNGIEISTERRRLGYRFACPEDVIGFFERTFGPCLTARRTITPRDRWADLHADLVKMTEEFFVGEDEDTRIEPEYLLVLGRKAR